MHSFNIEEIPGLMNNITRKIRLVTNDRERKVCLVKKKVDQLVDSPFSSADDIEETLEELIDLNMGYQLEKQFYVLLNRYELQNLERSNNYKLRFKNLYGI